MSYATTVTNKKGLHQKAFCIREELALNLELLNFSGDGISANT